MITYAFCTSISTFAQQDTEQLEPQNVSTADNLHKCWSLDLWTLEPLSRYVFLRFLIVELTTLKYSRLTSWRPRKEKEEEDDFDKSFFVMSTYGEVPCLCQITSNIRLCKREKEKNLIERGQSEKSSSESIREAGEWKTIDHSEKRRLLIWSNELFRRRMIHRHAHRQL